MPPLPCRPRLCGERRGGGGGLRGSGDGGPGICARASFSAGIWMVGTSTGHAGGGGGQAALRSSSAPKGSGRGGEAGGCTHA